MHDIVAAVLLSAIDVFIVAIVINVVVLSRRG
jgi:hypothetical protein